MTAPIRWNLSPTDSRVLATLRYLPVAFLGGYLGLAALLALVVLPELLDSPTLLALAVRFFVAFVTGVIGVVFCLAARYAA